MMANSVLAQYQPGVSVEDLTLILEKTPQNVWGALQDQRLFITGGTGFVGCWLLEALIWANQKLALNMHITLLSRNPDSFIAKAQHLAQHPIVTLLQGDVNNLSHINTEFDIVIHAATDVVNADSDFLATYNSIVNGTKETLELAKRCNSKRYLLTSSGAVYGRQPPSLSHIPETFTGAPETTAMNAAYGHAKRTSECLAQYYFHQFGLDVKIARCFALIGPYLPLDAHFAVGNFIRDGINNQTINVNGDGTAFRSYLYAADMTVWLLTILMNGKADQLYNLGSDQEISIKGVAEEISQLIYQKNNVNVAVKAAANHIAQRYVPNVDKAKNELGLAEYTHLQSSIQKTIQWEVQRRESTQPKTLDK